MSFFEDIAAGLDREGIESRVHDETMFVPITSEVEIHFVEIDPHLPAANVYIAAADVDEDDDDFEAVLVSVVFSVEDAVRTVAEHMATDQVITVLRDLLEGTDERITDLEFFQDSIVPNLVRAEVGDNSEIHVMVEVVDGTPCASVIFVALPESVDDLLDDAIDELWESDGDAELSDEDRERLFVNLEAEALYDGEDLDLGTFHDFDRLFDILSLAADHAEDWEAQLLPFDDNDFDEPDVYDIFGADDPDDEHDADAEDGDDDEEVDEEVDEDSDLNDDSHDDHDDEDLDDFADEDDEDDEDDEEDDFDEDDDGLSGNDLIEDVDTEDEV